MFGQRMKGDPIARHMAGPGETRYAERFLQASARTRAAGWRQEACSVFCLSPRSQSAEVLCRLLLLRELARQRAACCSPYGSRVGVVSL